MRQQSGLAQNQFAHGFEIVQRGFVPEMMKRLAHLWKKQFRLVAQREQSLRASKFFAGASNFQNLIRRHGVRAGVAGVAAEGAVSAIVAAEIGQWQKNFARVGDDARLERSLAARAAASSCDRSASAQAIKRSASMREMGIPRAQAGKHTSAHESCATGYARNFA